MISVVVGGPKGSERLLMIKFCTVGRLLVSVTKAVCCCGATDENGHCRKESEDCREKEKTMPNGTNDENIG